jgi:hypothetical protein
MSLRKDFATILERSRLEGWALVTLDLCIDTSRPTGEFEATVLMGVGFSSSDGRSQSAHARP